MTGHTVNWQQLAADVETARQARGLSLREVGRQTGVATSGLVKLRKGGKKLSADAVAALTAWLTPPTPDLDSETLADTIALCTGPDTAAAVDAALRYVTGRVEHWTQELLDDGITMIYTEHQSTCVQRAAKELRHYLHLTGARAQQPAITHQADDAAAHQDAPTSAALLPQDGQAEPQPTPRPAPASQGQDEDEGEPQPTVSRREPCPPPGD